MYVVGNHCQALFFKKRDQKCPMFMGRSQNLLTRFDTDRQCSRMLMNSDRKARLLGGGGGEEKKARLGSCPSSATP